MTVSETIRVLIIIMLAIITGMAVFSIFNSGIKNAAATVHTWIYGDQPQAQNPTNPTAANNNPATPLPVLQDTVCRITETRPKVDLLSYDTYNDWSGSLTKVARTAGSAKITLVFNTNVNLFSLQDAVQAYQEQCWGACMGSTSSQSQYALMKQGATNRGYDISYTTPNYYKSVDLTIKDSTMFGRYYIIKFKEQYLQGYCQTPPRKLGDCRYLDKDRKLMLTSNEAMIKFTT